MWTIPYKDAALISTPECQITFGAVAIGFTEIRVIRVSIAKQVVIQISRAFVNYINKINT